jgi:tetratricopeptide (TPR) repeat protein
VGCDFLDPTNVENPLTTAEDLARAAEPTRALLPGVRAQFARALNGTIVLTEVVSDNYSIHGTGLNGEYDFPRNVVPNIVNATAPSVGLYWNLQELRALATFVLEDIAPGDQTATSAQLAEVHYYRGMAFLLLGENFPAAPLEADGAPVAAADLLQRALADLTEALTRAGSGEFADRARAAIARAHRTAGNASQAAQAAQAALNAAGNSFVYTQRYDATSISNQAFVFTTQRALKEMQPLPRLDFLDPKYTALDAAVPVAKAEEMFLILAEVALVGGQLTTARGHLVSAIDQAQRRPRVNFNDNDARNNADLSIRPRSASIEVRADANSPFRSGLVLTRPGTISVPTISGTSLSADSVATLTGQEDLWHAFHLARQEIMFLEGRRMSDLGIRLPMMLREIDANPNISDGSPGTTVVVPSFIPAGNNMDLFTPAAVQPGTTQVTMTVDVNRILARERYSPLR